MPPVKGLGFWRSLLRIVTFGYAYSDQAKEIARQEQNYKAARARLQTAREQRAKTVQQELNDVPAVEQERKNDAEQEKLDEELKTVRAEANLKSIGLENHLSLFSADPFMEPNITVTYKKDGSIDNHGVYTPNEHRDLTVFCKNAEQRSAEQEELMNSMSQEERENYNPCKFVEFDQASIKLGEKGEPLTDREFAAVAMCTCWREDHAYGEFTRSSNYDPTLEESRIDAGFPEKDVKLLVGINSRSMMTTDNFMAKGREQQGAKIATYLNKPRIDTAEAFKAYQNNNKEPLAKLIANGINRVWENFNTTGATQRLDNDLIGCAEAADCLLSLMEKDPALKDIALQHGMTDETLEMAKGMVQLNKLESEDRFATLKMAEARAKHKELTAEEKKACAKQILLSRLAMQQVQHHRMMVVDNPNSKNRQLLDKLTFKMFPERIENGMKTPINTWKKSPVKGELFQENLPIMESGLNALYGEKPKILLELAKTEELNQLEHLADTIIEQEHLADPNLSTEDLYQKLKIGGPKAIRLSEAVERAMQKDAPGLQEIPEEAKDLQMEQPKAELPQQEKRDAQQGGLQRNA